MTTILSAQDRCDRCGARAAVLISIPVAGELLFCAHDYDKNALQLILRGAVVVADEREQVSA